ncbi:MAG: potassium channel protein [Acidimicrobiia bacterium]|nr:potassium channel protein [Acidimicrobiia bacterium]
MESTKPRNLKAMLSEAKDVSELMVDLGYAAVFFGDAGMAAEVTSLEGQLSQLVYEMRTVSVLGARSPRDAESMSGVLQLISAIERIGNAAVEIGRVVTRHLGIPSALLADLAGAEEVSHWVRVRPGSEMDGRSIEALSLPTEFGMTIVAVRRGDDWFIDPSEDLVLEPGDVPILQGSPQGIPMLRSAAGAPEWVPPMVDDQVALTDLDRAIDVLVDMKNVSEVAVGLAYSALLFNDRPLSREVNRLEDRLDEMREQIELWVLRAAGDVVDPSGLRGLLHLAHASETIGDSAQQIVWTVEAGVEVHPVFAAAMGESDEVIMRVPIAPGSPIAGRSSREYNLELETGFYLLAVVRNDAYRYRRRAPIQYVPGDELLAIGPDEGREMLAAACGYRLEHDDPTGELMLVALETTS